jgi:hypothetical protein
VTLLVRVKLFEKYFKNIQKYSKIFKNIRKYSKIFKNIRKYSKIFKNIRKYSKIFEIYIRDKRVILIKNIYSKFGSLGALASMASNDRM